MSYNILSFKKYNRKLKVVPEINKSNLDEYGNDPVVANFESELARALIQYGSIDALLHVNSIILRYLENRRRTYCRDEEFIVLYNEICELGLQLKNNNRAGFLL